MDDFGPDDLAQAAALPVADKSTGDPSAPPPSGAQYLLKVRLEAKKFPDFIMRVPKRKNKKKKVHQIDFPKIRSPPQYSLDPFIKADKSICPTSSWADDTLRSFKRVRDKVNEARSLSNNPLCDNDIHKVPHVRNTSAWKVIILGENDEKANDSELKGIIYNSKNARGPLLSVIVQFPQGAIIDFIEEMTSWVKELGWSHQAAVWTYSFLACLELPVVGETVAILRDLSRTCSSIRAKHVKINNKPLITSLNLIICIIGQFFGQLDICDEYSGKGVVTASSPQPQPQPSTSGLNQADLRNLVRLQNPPRSAQDSILLDREIEVIKERMRKLNAELTPTEKKKPPEKRK